MDVLDLLRHEHAAARDWFAVIERAATAEERAAAFDRLRAVLQAYAASERTVFYASLARAQQTRADIRSGIDRHATIAHLIERLCGLDPASPAWLGLARALRDAVDAHIQEEESRTFVHARQALPRARLEELGAEMAAARR